MSPKEKILLELAGTTRRARWGAPVRMLKRWAGIRPRRVPLEGCASILVVRPDGIGDVVMMSPFWRQLRASAPGARIVVLTNKTCRSLLEHCPYVDEVWSLPFQAASNDRHRSRLALAAMKLKLSRCFRGFDLVLLPRADADWYDSELVAHLLTGRGAVLMNSAAFVRWTIKPPQDPALADTRHHVQTAQSEVLSNLEFLRFCGSELQGGSELEFWSSAADEAFAEQWFARLDSKRPKLVFHPPSGRSPLKKWPVGRSREFLSKLVAATDFEVIVVGGRQDRWALDELASMQGDRVHLALDRFSTQQLGVVIRRSGYFVGGDSGPMHIAAAVDARVVGIFGYASELRFRPRSDRVHIVSLRLPCSPDQRGTLEANCMSCAHGVNRCLDELTADQVLSETLRFFEVEPVVTDQKQEVRK